MEHARNTKARDWGNDMYGALARGTAAFSNCVYEKKYLRAKRMTGTVGQAAEETKKNSWKKLLARNKNSSRENGIENVE